MTPEGRIKEGVKKVLRKHGVYWHCPVQNGMGEPSLDFICCHHGWYIAIETKAPGKKPTQRQEVTIKRITDTGGFVFVIDSDEAIQSLDAHLPFFQPMFNAHRELHHESR